MDITSQDSRGNNSKEVSLSGPQKTFKKFVRFWLAQVSLLIGGKYFPICYFDCGG